MQQNNDKDTNQNESKPEKPPKQEIVISPATKDQAQAAQAYIERKYAKMLQLERDSKENWILLQKQMDAMSIPNSEQDIIKREILQKEMNHLRKLRQQVTVADFELLAIIGRGAFGEVRVCRDKENKEVVAIKKMQKSEMLLKNQIGHIRAERDVLSTLNNPWIVELQCSFQDDRHLYLVMEFLSGGDLMTVLMQKDILTEEESQFYIAELVLAVDSVHKMNYIHRDLQPDNILLTKDGHIQLSDFGLCQHTEIKPKIDFGRKNAPITTPQQDFDKNPVSILTKRPSQFQRNRQLAYSTVGTPDYIAPEVFGQQGYTEIVDWWSIGVILFEMLVGYPPFFSDEASVTCQKILHWKQTFMIPPEANLSVAASDLIKKLIADPSERLGINGVEQIKVHPFFVGVDWKKIRDKKAPYIPQVQSDVDVSNFDQFEEEENWAGDDKFKRNRKLDINFVGYTFKRQLEIQKSRVVEALESLQKYRMSSPRPGGSPRNVGGSPRPHNKDDYNQNQIHEQIAPPTNLYNFMKPGSPRAQSPTTMQKTNLNNNYLLQTSKLQYIPASSETSERSSSPKPYLNNNNNNNNNQLLYSNNLSSNSSLYNNSTQNMYNSSQVKMPPKNGLNGITSHQYMPPSSNGNSSQNLYSPTNGSGSNNNFKKVQSPLNINTNSTNQLQQLGFSNQSQGSPKGINTGFNFPSNRAGSPYQNHGQN